MTLQVEQDRAVMGSGETHRGLPPLQTQDWARLENVKRENDRGWQW